MSPDPYYGSYSLTSPQSFINRYNYTLNNPIGFTDPLGLHTEQLGNCLYDVEIATVDGQYDSTVYDLLGCFSAGGGGGSGSGGSGGGGGSASSAPNNGQFRLASYKPLNPCSNASPSGLDYSTTNAQQHIMQNHSPGGKGPSFYAGDFAAVQALNGSTLMYGTLAPASFQRMGTYTLQWTTPQPFDWLGITLYIGTGQTGQLTSTNRLVVKTNCSTVITSYPVTP